MKMNKKWCITLGIVLVMITFVPVFAQSEGVFDSITRIVGGKSKVLLYSIIGGGLGVVFSLLKNKNRRKR